MPKMQIMARELRLVSPDIGGVGALGNVEGTELFSLRLARMLTTDEIVGRMPPHGSRNPDQYSRKTRWVGRSHPFLAIWWLDHTADGQVLPRMGRTGRQLAAL